MSDRPTINSADDIRRAKLPRAKLGGYEREATETLLDAVASRYDMLRWAHQQLQERVAELERQLERASKTEYLAGRSLLAAQKQTRLLREAARREAELVVKKARAHGEQLLGEATRQHAALVAEVERLTATRDERLRAVEEEFQGRRAEAQAQADLFLAEARAHVEDAAREADEERIRAREELRRLRGLGETTRADLREFLHEVLEQVERIGKAPGTVDEPGAHSPGADLHEIAAAFRPVESGSDAAS